MPPRDRILVCDYDPRWASLYEEERTRIIGAIGPFVADVQHVGSTSVPGLAAKPVIDIAVALRRQEDGEKCVAPLQALGYEYRGEAGIPGRFYFRKLTSEPEPGQTFGTERPVGRTHHLHAYPVTHPDWQRLLLFRDYLRMTPEAAAEYAALKRELAARCEDVEEYAEAKTAFVRECLEKAGSRPRGAIEIVEYDPRWTAMYEEERERIAQELGEWLVDVQHVGSTSVPGLAAKPIIDIMPGVQSLEDTPRIVEAMQRLGYQYFPEYEDELPERRYFRKPAGEAFRGWGTHHVHVVETASAFWRRHIAFRDYLRSHPDAAREYGELKRGLAARFGNDREGYTDAKTEFITGIERLSFDSSACRRTAQDERDRRAGV